MSKSKKPSRRRATTPPRTTLNFEAMARAVVVARVSVIPSVTDFLDADEEAAMIEAYIDQRCADDRKQALRAAARSDGNDNQTPTDIVWIKQEIAYALGVEVGRRLIRGAR